MKTYTRQQNARIPAHALSYIINGDASGLDAEEKAVVDNWLNSWDNDVRAVNGTLNFIQHDERTFHTKYPEFGLPCMCEEWDIEIWVED